MPTAIVTPAALVSFAGELAKSADSISKRKSKAVRLVTESRAVWKDKKYDRFRRVFDQTVKALDQFARMTEEYSAFLERKASLAQRYLNNR